MRDCVVEFTSVISIPVVAMDENVVHQAFMSETKDVLNKCNPQLCNLSALMETQPMLQPSTLSLHENISNEEIKADHLFSCSFVLALFGLTSCSHMSQVSPFLFLSVCRD